MLINAFKNVECHFRVFFFNALHCFYATFSAYICAQELNTVLFFFQYKLLLLTSVTIFTVIVLFFVQFSYICHFNKYHNIYFDTAPQKMPQVRDGSVISRKGTCDQWHFWSLNLEQSIHFCSSMYYEEIFAPKRRDWEKRLCTRRDLMLSSVYELASFYVLMQADW